MNWFKHKTNAAAENEFLASLMARYKDPHKPYAMWFMLLETIAARMDKSDNCSTTYPVKIWCEKLHVREKGLHEFISNCADISGQLLERSRKEVGKKSDFFHTLSGNNLTITIPNLLKLRDNYTSDLEVSTKRLPSKEVDTDKELINKDSLSLEGEKASSPPGPVSPPNPTPGPGGSLSCRTPSLEAEPKTLAPDTHGSAFSFPDFYNRYLEIVNTERPQQLPFNPRYTNPVLEARFEANILTLVAAWGPDKFLSSFFAWLDEYHSVKGEYPFMDGMCFKLESEVKYHLKKTDRPAAPEYPPGVEPLAP